VIFAEVGYYEPWWAQILKALAIPPTGPGQSGHGA